jgi:hypothetical protein
MNLSLSESHSRVSQYLFSTVLNFLKNDPPRSAEALVAAAGSFVDVRVVAWAHTEAVTNSTLANKGAEAAFERGKGRISLVSGQYC